MCQNFVYDNLLINFFFIFEELKRWHKRGFYFTLDINLLDIPTMNSNCGLQRWRGRAGRSQWPNIASRRRGTVLEIMGSTARGGDGWGLPHLGVQLRQRGTMHPCTGHDGNAGPRFTSGASQLLHCSLALGGEVPTTFVSLWLFLNVIKDQDHRAQGV